MSDVDEELKRVRLQREQMALQDELDRRARRTQAVDLAHNVAATTREAGIKAAKITRTVVLCVFFGIATSFVVWTYLALQNSQQVQGGFEYRLGWYMSVKFLEGGLIGLLGIVWCYYHWFRNKPRRLPR